MDLAKYSGILLTPSAAFPVLLPDALVQNGLRLSTTCRVLCGEVHHSAHPFPRTPAQLRV
eukprot:5730288-Pleurochrysis_carterae.AAC.1